MKNSPQKELLHGEGLASGGGGVYADAISKEQTGKATLGKRGASFPASKHSERKRDMLKGI